MVPTLPIRRMSKLQTLRGQDAYWRAQSKGDDTSGTAERRGQVRGYDVRIRSYLVLSLAP